MVLQVRVCHIFEYAGGVEHAIVQRHQPAASLTAPAATVAAAAAAVGLSGCLATSSAAAAEVLACCSLLPSCHLCPVHAPLHPTFLLPGVRLSEVLARCGVGTAESGARFVHFSGPLDELPAGGSMGPGAGKAGREQGGEDNAAASSRSCYTTSLELHQCIDPAHDVLLAFKQNGRYEGAWRL